MPELGGNVDMGFLTDGVEGIMKFVHEMPLHTIVILAVVGVIAFITLRAVYG